MNRQKYLNYISERLHTLAGRIETGGKLNNLELHNLSENFYKDLLNLLYDFKLKNLNNIEQNAVAIDLIDERNQIVIQVSAQNDKSKIEDSLAKISTDYNGYNFKFMSISKGVDGLKSKRINNSSMLSFNAQNDIIDIASIMRDVSASTIDKMESIYEFICAELGVEISREKITTNLASLINILSQEDLSPDGKFAVRKPYEIEKKIKHNDLNEMVYLIKEYKIYEAQVDGVYGEFNAQGSNKSLSVYQSINKLYHDCKNEYTSADEIFLSVIKGLRSKVLESSNYDSNLPDEELDLCLNILSVHAFIKCKILEEPR